MNKLPVVLSGAVEESCWQPLPTPSIEGEYGRRAEIRRQLLAEGFVPQAGDPYLACLNRHELTEEEQKRANAYRQLQDSGKDRKVNALDLEIQERTARAIYGDLLGYAPEREMVTQQLAPRWYNLQTYINARDLVGLETVEHFGEVPIRGMDVRETLETREMMQLLTRIKEDTGDYPTPEELGLVAVHETICTDRVVRAKTTTENLGYDEHHTNDALQTVDKHNAFVDSFKALSTEQANAALNEGAVVLWNAGGAGKHFVVEFQETV